MLDMCRCGHECVCVITSRNTIKVLYSLNNFKCTMHYCRMDTLLYSGSLDPQIDLEQSTIPTECHISPPLDLW